MSTQTPNRNLPGMVNDPNQPTEPTRREVEPQTPSPQTPAQPSPSPQPPEFNHKETHEIEQPRMGDDPKGLVLEGRAKGPVPTPD